MKIPDRAWVENKGRPAFAAMAAAQGVNLELRRFNSEGAWSADGRQETTGEVLWSGRGILIPLTDQQRSTLPTGLLPSPHFGVYLPFDAPAGKPDYYVHWPTKNLNHYLARDAIDWFGVYWDLVVGAPGERSQ